MSDWKIFELILFNSIYNSVKYNKHIDGDILFVITCKPKKNSSNRDLASQSVSKSSNISRNTNYSKYMLEVEIIDTGEGIHKDRQNLLFVPFLEIRNLQGITSA